MTESVDLQSGTYTGTREADGWVLRRPGGEVVGEPFKRWVDARAAAVRDAAGRPLSGAPRPVKRVAGLPRVICGLSGCETSVVVNSRYRRGEFEAGRPLFCSREHKRLSAGAAPGSEDVDLDAQHRADCAVILEVLQQSPAQRMTALTVRSGLPPRHRLRRKGGEVTVATLMQEMARVGMLRQPHRGGYLLPPTGTDARPEGSRRSSR